MLKLEEKNGPKEVEIRTDYIRTPMNLDQSQNSQTHICRSRIPPCGRWLLSAFHLNACVFPEGQTSPVESIFDSSRKHNLVGSLWTVVSYKTIITGLSAWGSVWSMLKLLVIFNT